MYKILSNKNMINKESNKGFTLIELVVVIAILAILALIAVPAFNGYKAKAVQTKDLQNARIGYTYLLLEDHLLSADELHKALNLPDSDVLLINEDGSVTVNNQTYPFLIGGDNEGEVPAAPLDNFKFIPRSFAPNEYTDPDDGIVKKGYWKYVGPTDVSVINIPKIMYKETLKDTYMMFQSNNNITTQKINFEDSSIVTNMSRMFYNATTFNGEIDHWDTSKVTNMSYMFGSAESFNQDINNWDVSKVTDMSFMFIGAKSFNQDIRGWDVSNVTNMSHMFEILQNFNQDISGWDTSSVTDMSYMFSNSNFNQDISGWDVSNVTNMERMFRGNKSFNQDISQWDVSNVTSWSGFYDLSGLESDLTKVPQFR